MERAQTIKDIIVLLLVASFVLLWNLGTGSLTSWDEAVYAQVAREILISNNWVDLTYMGGAWSDKPPLCMWMTAIFYKLFGVSEFSARFFSSLCGIGTIVVTYAFAKKLYSRKTALVAALMLLSTQHFIWSAKVSMLDSALTFFTISSFFCLKKAEDKKIYLFFSVLAFACAFLTKGVAALVIPFVGLLYLFSTKRTSVLKEPIFVIGSLVCLGVVVWWHWVAFSHYGKNFVSGYFTTHFFNRTTTALDGHTGGIFTYFKVLPNKGRPWGVFELIALVAAVWQVFKNREKKHIFPLLWAISVFMIASIVRTKLHWYIIPIYPALAILLGWGLCALFKRNAVPVAILLAASGLFYLSSLKGILNLDYTPETKKIAYITRQKLPRGEKVFLYGISDPAAWFYFSLIGNSISTEAELRNLLKQKDRYIVFEKNTFNSFPKSGFVVLAENLNLIVVKTE
ncbi:MAG: glycosyltransferase family 39 protein [Candidatus Omnitrophota bacterium]